MKRILSTVLSAAMVGSLAFVVSPTRAADAPADKPATPANTAPDRSLSRPTAELNFNGNSLGDVIDFLADVTGANFSVDWKALDAAKVGKDTPITLKLTGAITLKKALHLILNQAGGTGTLTFYVDEGVIQITTQEQEDKQMITRIYPIQDLLFQAPDYNDAPQLSLQTQNQNTGGGGATGGGGGGGGSQSLFGQTSTSSASTNAIQSRKDRADEIIKLITDSVRPDIWQVNGGTATISFFRDSLIVTAPRSVHEMLASR